MNLWPLLPFLGLLLGVQSQVCDPPYEYYFNVTDQNYIDALSSSCTTLRGNLMIATNFTGKFFLPNITNITGEIEWDWFDFKPAPKVTTIDLPHLQYLKDGISLNTLADTLERISIPKLEYIRYIFLTQYIDHAEVDFSGLKKVDDISVSGNYSRVSFDSLQNVTNELHICNQEPCGIYHKVVEGPRRAMNVSLPNLEVTNRLIVAGDLSELNLPKLSSADLKVHSLNTSVQFDFLQFARADYSLDLQGHITGLSMPRLKEVVGNLIVKSSHPLNITLPVAKADTAIFSGQIANVSLPNLSDFSSLHIDSDLPLDCDPVINQLNETSIEPKNEFSLGCKSTYEKPPRLSTKAKVAIGVVVGVVGSGALLGGIFFCRKRRASKRKKSESVVELTTFGVGDRREGLGVAQGRGEAEAEAQDDPPPPYTAERG